MQELHLPGYAFKVREAPEGEQIFDLVRKQYVALTPEEWVRQHFLNFLIDHRDCPISLIKVERGLSSSGVNMRTDIVVHGKEGEPLALVECKAPTVKINEGTIDQVFRYDRVLNIKFVLLTNGIEHYCFEVDRTKNQMKPLNEIPRYHEMLNRPRRVHG